MKSIKKILVVTRGEKGSICVGKSTVKEFDAQKKLESGLWLPDSSSGCCRSVGPCLLCGSFCLAACRVLPLLLLSFRPRFVFVSFSFHFSAANLISVKLQLQCAVNSRGRASIKSPPSDFFFVCSHWMTFTVAP